MSHLVITSAGLNEVNQSSVAPQFALKYFLPVYDQRIDPDIHTSFGDTSALPLSASQSTSDGNNDINGEILWNLTNISTSAYDISDSDQYLYIVDGMAFDGVNATDTTQDATSVFNNIKNTLGDIKPLSPYVSGVNGSHIGDGDFTFTSGVSGSGYQTSAFSFSDRSYLFDTVTYIPELNDNGVVTALFKMKLNSDSGNFKFNKFAIYLQRLTATGAIDSGYDPVLFAFAVLNKTIVINNTNEYIQNFELDVKLSFEVSSGNEIYFDTEYWTKIPSVSGNGLFTEYDVAIGTSGTGGSWNPQAHVHITDGTKSQLKLSNDYSTNGIDFNVTSGTYVNITTDSTKGILAVGDGCISEGQNSCSFGTNTSALGDNDFVTGNSTISTDGQYNSVHGYNVSAIGTGSLASGKNNTFESDYGIQGGENNTNSNSNHVIIGGKNNVISTSNSSIYGGENNTSTGSSYSIQNGITNELDGSSYSIQNGLGNKLDNSLYNTQNGRYNEILSCEKVLQGGDNNIISACSNSFQMGAYNTNDNSNSIIQCGLATSAELSDYCLINGRENISLNGSYSLNSGYNNILRNYGSSILGYDNTTDGFKSTIIGNNNTNTGHNSMIFGNDNTNINAIDNKSIIIGDNIDNTGVNAICIGSNFNNYVNNSTLIKDSAVFVSATNTVTTTSNQVFITSTDDDITFTNSNSRSHSEFYEILNLSAVTDCIIETGLDPSTTIIDYEVLIYTQIGDIAYKPLHPDANAYFSVKIKSDADNWYLLIENRGTLVGYNTAKCLYNIKYVT